MEIAIWILFCLVMAVPAAMLFWEQEKVSRLQAECRELEKEISRDWDIRLKHIDQLNRKISEIYKNR